MNSVKRCEGYALITSLIVTAVVTGLVIGFVNVVNTEQKIARNDTDYSSAFYAAEAGLEKLNSDLSKLFQASVFPTQSEITDIQASGKRPVLTGVTYSTYSASGGQSTTLTANLSNSATTATVASTTGWPSSGYFMIEAEEITYSGKTTTTFTGLARGQSSSTAVAHTSGKTATRAKVISISEGANSGLNAQVIPFTLEVIAQAGAGSEARLRREVQVALIPVFQFGVFSDSDLSFFAGPAFNFGGRVHTNGHLFLAAGSGGTTLSQKVTSAAQIIRAELANGVLTSVNHTGDVAVIQTPGTTRLLAVDEASVTGGPGSSADTGWPTISLTTYNGNILNVDTGAKPLTLPFAGGSASPIEIIKRPPDGESATSLLGESRLYNQASLRILISDVETNLPGDSGHPLTTAGLTASPHNYVVQNAASFNPPFAAANPNDPDFLTSADADETGNANLIDGFIRIDRQNSDGTWTDVTMDILNLGISTNQANAILRFQKPRWDLLDTTNSLNATDYIPINMYDTRESHFRDSGYPSFLRKIGIMNLIELDVNNLKKWFEGASGFGTAGTLALTNNGYIVYFSDRRGNRNSAGDETGEFGFEDVVNGNVSGGLPNGTIQTGEDLNQNNSLDVYGANLPYSPFTNSNDLWNTQIPIPVSQQAIDLAEDLDTTETDIDVSNAGSLTIPGHYRIDNEIVNCTAVATNTLTCSRGQQGTTIASHVPSMIDLAEDLDTTETSIDVSSDTNITVPGYYHIGVETMLCTSKASNTLTCQRAQLGTSATTHSMGGSHTKEDIDATETDLDVVNGGNISVPGYYRIENETILCTSKPATHRITCTRGVLGTTAATHNPSLSNTMNENLDTTESTFDIASSTGFTNNTYFRVDDEVVFCTGVGTNQLTGCSRGQLGTTAATHSNGAAIKKNITFRPARVAPVNVFTSERGVKNRVHYFRRALRLVNGSNTSTVNNLPTPGFTVASENPVYVLGNYNAYTGSTGFNGPHSFSAVIADMVTLLSNSWNDNNSFQSPYNKDNRPRSETNFRLAIAAGKGRNFPQPSDATGTPDFGTDGGTHNFLRFLENGGDSIWYQGSLVSLYFFRQATGTYKCCNSVYGAPTRQYTFDNDFLVPSQLPPGTPRFRDINNLSFRQTIRADQ
jgi:Tfp pilus assembly protein PilX